MSSPENKDDVRESKTCTENAEMTTEVGNSDKNDKLSGDEPETIPQMSKNQLKKLRKREKWLAVKKEKRKEEKQKKKERLAAKRARGEEIGPGRKQLKTNLMANSACKVEVAVDLGLDEYMSEKDMKSLTDQLRHCYSDNRRAENPVQLYFCGDSGKTLPRLEEIGDFKRWDVNVDVRKYDEIFPKEKIVYLSSESTNVLSRLDEGKVYVIGGLVDHNRHKGLCHQLAEEKGVAHAQLPISEYFKMSSRKVLTVNHVFAILLKFTECQDWKESFLSQMPQRKVADLTEIDTKKLSPSSKNVANNVDDNVDNNENVSDHSDICIDSNMNDRNDCKNETEKNDIEKKEEVKS